MKRLTSRQVIKHSDGTEHTETYCHGHRYGPAAFPHKYGTSESQEYKNYCEMVDRLALHEDVDEQRQACIHNAGDHCTVLSDAEVKQPCIEGPCPDHATLAEQQANLARKTDQLREAMKLLELAAQDMKPIEYCDHCYYGLVKLNVRNKPIRCRQCDGQSGWRWQHAAHYEALKAELKEEVRT